MELNPRLYNKIIDPLLKSLHERICRQVDDGSRVLDIACGTGSLAIMLSEKCSHVSGIDLYEPMIRFATITAERSALTHVDFRVADATNLSGFKNKSFDVATMSLALHQFKPDERKQILAEAFRLAPRLIVADYAEPVLSGFLRTSVHIAERIAGRTHYRNFNSYRLEGGTDAIAENLHYKILHAELSASGVFSVMIAEE